MRLLLLGHSLGVGGAERVTAAMANEWAERGYEVTLATLASLPDAYELLPSVRRISLDLATEGGNPFAATRNWIRRVRAVRRLVREVRPDIAIGVMDTYNILIGFAASKRDGIATIGWEHTHPSRLDPRSARGRLRSWAYGRLDGVVALTPEARDFLRAHTRSRRVVVIPNVLVFPLPQQPPVVTPLSVVPSDRLVLLSVGRLDPVKRFDRLIDAFHLIAEQHPDWQLVIIGDGPQRSALERQIARLRLQSRVVLPGRAGNVAEWYERAALYALSSDFEGLPCTLIEALAYGLPVVSVDCESGPRHVVRDGVDGLLVRPIDSAALAAALARVMSDEPLRRALGSRASEARERFSRERITAEWEALFEEVRSAHE